MEATYQELLERIRSKRVTVGIYGLGYVGLPLSLAFCEAGVSVVGFDIDQRKIDSLLAGQSYIKHLASDRVSAALATGSYKVTSRFEETPNVDAVILCVPTPLGTHLDPDVSYIERTMGAILPHVRRGQLFCLESTTYPGSSEELIAAPLRQKGFEVGRDVFVAYSPEREDPGNPVYETHTITKVVGGATERCLRLASELYKLAIVGVHEVSSMEAAEMAKLLENIYRAVNIGLVNELKVVADRMGLDIHEIIRAAATKPFGFAAFYPGPGLGGHCIPIDPFYLTWKAKEYGVHTRFIELAGEVNRSMPQYVVDKTVEGLNLQRKSVNGSRVLIVGFAYKKNVDDARETPAAEVIELLGDKGAHVDLYDPFIPRTPEMRRGLRVLESVRWDAPTLESYDAVVIVTDHDGIDYAFLQAHAILIIDARGRYPRGTPNVVSA